MFKLKQLAGIALIAGAISACEEKDLNIGSTLTGSVDQLNVNAATFNVETRTVVADSVCPILLRSNTCYFGQVKDTETETYVKSEFMTQFHLLEAYQLPDIDSIASKEQGLPVADSCLITLYLKNPLRQSDSLTAMKMNIYELAKPVEEGQQYYSNFDLRTAGYIREDSPLTRSQMFSYENLKLTDTERKNSDSYTYTNYIILRLNDKYTDRDGKTYKNYGSYLMQTYYQHPEYFRNFYQFIHHVCPGFFFEIADGTGFYAQVPEISLRTFFTIHQSDSIVKSATTLAATSEVLQTTKVTNDMDKLATIARDADTCTYIKSPAGLFTEVTLPIDEMMAGHEQDSLMAAKIAFQRLNSNEADNDRLSKPAYLLMVERDSVESFFLNKKLTDSKRTYYTSCSTDNTYAYTNISNLISALVKDKAEGLKHNPNWAAEHPNWNKVVLIPIDLTYYSNSSTGSQTVTNIDHSMVVSSTRLVGGPRNPNDPVKLSVMFTNLNGK